MRSSESSNAQPEMTKFMQRWRQSLPEMKNNHAMKQVWEMLKTLKQDFKKDKEN